MKISSYIFLVIISTLFFAGCEKDKSIVKTKVSGLVQKGPFINGTSINMYELNSSLAQTGKVFSTQIVNNTGSFEITNINLSSAYVEFSANGYYFDEVKGAITPSQVNLFALSDLTDISTVNVNLMTHLEKSRVENLVAGGKSFAAAKTDAQKEILAIFGFSLPEMDDSESLDITKNSEQNAILLAVSLILQGNLNTGKFTELLANIVNDIKTDGTLNSEALLSTLRTNAQSLDLNQVRTNLVNRYAEIGLSASIPDFEKYVTQFLGFTGTAPTVATTIAGSFTTSSAVVEGTVNPNDLATTVSFEYGTSTAYGSSVDILNNPLRGHGVIQVSVGLKNLNINTLYHYRIKAVNSKGTSYGEDKTFSTIGTLTDVEGNSYKVVSIFTQVWMAENLRTTKYNDGTDILTNLSDAEWITTTSGAYAIYDNSAANEAIYGKLYNWYAVTNSKKICPAGWHVPTPSEWSLLIDNIGGFFYAGDKLKESGSAHWTTANLGTDNYGFKVLPGGYRWEYNGVYDQLGHTAVFWQTTGAAETDIKTQRFWSSSRQSIQDYGYKNAGYSVRCIRD